MNVTNVIVKNDYCIGCGVCAGLCPKDNLQMDWSKKGELIPHTIGTCNDNCSICLDLCPFYDHENNQDSIANNLFSKIKDIKYDEYAGYYLNCYVGNVKNEEKRLKSASGGAATSFLSTLLEDKIVDKVVAVKPSTDSERMFKFNVLSSPKQINSCAGSAYYPIDLSKILKQILNEKEEFKYAIIALPCFVYSLRLAMEKIPKLKRKIKFIASLTCGQLQNRFCTELLALESGISVKKLLSMDFRRKSENEPASNFSYVALDKNRKEGVPLLSIGLPYHLWYYHYFKQNACNFCDDIFGELSDITFMDAWLPEYIKDYRGTSIIITRSSIAQDILYDSNELDLKFIKVGNVLKSQWGVIEKKRTLLKGNLYKKNLSNIWYPKKRVNPCENIYNKNREFIELTDEVQCISKELWSKHRLDASNDGFWEDCIILESKIKKFEDKTKIKNLLEIPVNYFKRYIRDDNG